MIDPLETVLSFLKTDGALAELVGNRIASKHRFGDASRAQAGQGAPYWQIGSAGLTVRLDGGDPEIYAPVQNVRLEVRCYAQGAHEAMQVWRRVVELARGCERVSVDTSDGGALLHEFLQASGPSTLWDNNLGMDFVLSFFNASVSEEEI